jgi:agmatine deiminase
MSVLATKLGYRMPAEWEPHHGTWLAWPHHRDDWPDRFGPIPYVYAEIVRHLHATEQVFILVNSTRHEQRARDVLSHGRFDERRICFVHIPTNRSWTRDYGPIFVVDEHGRLAVTDWRFNGWAKYPNWKRDDAVPGRISKLLDVPIRQPCVDGQRLVLEGGSIDVNGRGLMLTTEECLLSPVQQRNPGVSRDQLQRAFDEYLGVRKVLWLGRGIAGDDTHGHVDDVARFVGPTRVIAAVEDDAGDANHEPLRENLERLRSMTDAEGRALAVTTLPMPAPIWVDGQRLPASYVNFYIANDRVLVPTFNDPRDRQALGILADLFPDRMVVGIHAVDLVLGLGTLHCLTQQQPRT